MKKLPILPLKNLVLLPKAVTLVKVFRSCSAQAVNESLKNFGSEIFVSFQKNPDIEDLSIHDINPFGVVAKIYECVEEKDGSLKILVEGLFRAKADLIYSTSNQEAYYFSADIAPLSSNKKPDFAKDAAFLRSLKKSFNEYQSNVGEAISPAIIKSIKEAEDLSLLVDLISANIELEFDERVFLLESPNVTDRAFKLFSLLEQEVEIAKVERNIKKRVQTQVEKHQKDYYLNEQVRAIYKELGKEDHILEVEKLKSDAKKARLSAEALDKVLTECKRLEQMQPSSPEAVVSRSYIETILSLPWYKKTKDPVSLASAKDIFEKSHFGMIKAKETILDFIAAKKFAKEELKTSPIICLVGAPGVGKTSLASSIADALGRKFVRISLGGLRDEAEIRGHRKTYIGAMPGKIISAMKKAGVTNPVILLDEIDKMSIDFRGDPSAALLEVLDPEQNKSFVDHFLEVGFDLSEVIFIATANHYDGIPYPLLDRMEVIGLSGYTDDEKLKIAERFLLPKLFKEHAIENKKITFAADVLKKIISEYTKEAGIRQLTRSLLKVVRKSIGLLLAKKTSVDVSTKDIEEWLGYPKYKQPQLTTKEVCGLATGLAWTEVGGDILEVEAVKLNGKGSLTITGQLGEVMQESAQASLSCIRSRSRSLGLRDNFYSNYDLHIHFPEGSTPKEGPSAGITCATAIASVFTGIPVRRDVAMSGEITLQGRVLPIGGLKEKLLAAERNGIKKVLLPKDNVPEFNDVKKEQPINVEVVFVETLDEVFEHALTRKPVAIKKPMKKKVDKKEVKAPKKASKKAPLKPTKKKKK